MRRITKVTSSDDKVTIEIDDPAQPEELKNSIAVEVTVGVTNEMSIFMYKGDTKYNLVLNGKVKQQPLRQNMMNVVDAQLESALKLFREISQDEEVE